MLTPGARSAARVKDASAPPNCPSRICALPWRRQPALASVINRLALHARLM